MATPMAWHCPDRLENHTEPHGHGCPHHSCMGLPCSTRDQTCGLHSSDTDRFIFVAGPTTCTNSTKNLSVLVFDQDRTRLWQKLSLCCSCKRNKKIRIFFGPLSQHATGRPHTHSTPCFASSNVKAKHAGTVFFTRKGFQVPCFVKNSDTHRFVARNMRLRQSARKDLLRLSQSKCFQICLLDASGNFLILVKPLDAQV
jgi:hypothetical protein